MAKRVELGGLTPQEAEAARLRATGLSQTESYRRAFKIVRAKPKGLWERASRLFARPEVQARIDELLRASKVADILSVGQSFAELQDMKRAAFEDGNHTACAQYKRLEMQALGMTKDIVAISLEQRSSDSELIQRVADGDPAMVAALREILGASDGFTEH